MVTVIFLVLVVLFLVLAIWGDDAQKKNEPRIKGLLDAMGISTADVLFKSKYVSGHPDMDTSGIDISFLIKDNSIGLYFIPSGLMMSDPIKHGSIPVASIKNIIAEDKTTVEKRVTVGRLLMTGVFALAWKKKKVTEAAYLIIEWNDGRFDHETIFEFSGAGAMQAANTARNALIKATR